MSDVTINNLPTASTIDATTDYLPIYTASALATQKITRNTYLGLSSAPVGLTDSQTLTNKILTAPALSSPVLSGTITGTYTIGGTPTFPSSVVTLTGSQTLTNKILTSPTINGPTITNATLSADTITGFSSSTTGTIYGVPVASGLISNSNTVSGAALTSNSIPSGVLQTNAVSAANLATNAIELGYAQITTLFTTTATPALTDVTGLSVTVTVPSGGRDIEIDVYAGGFRCSAGNTITMAIVEGSTVLQTGLVSAVPSNYGIANVIAKISAPTAGNHTYKVQVAQSGAGTITVGAGSTPGAGAFGPAFILVKAI